MLPISSTGMCRGEIIKQVAAVMSSKHKLQKMQLDIDIEPTFSFPHMIGIDKQMDKSEG